MWIKAQSGYFYNRDKFFLIAVEKPVNTSGYQVLAQAQAAVRNPEYVSNPAAVVLGAYKTREEAQAALERLFASGGEVFDMASPESES